MNNINLILCIVLLTLGIIFIFIQYRRSKSEKPTIEQSQRLTIDKLVDIVKTALADAIKEDSYAGLDNEAFAAMYNRVNRIQTAMRECVDCVDSAKTVVQSLIRTVLAKRLETAEDIIEVVDFFDPNLDVMIKFEIILYYYQKKHGKDSMKYMMEKYKLDEERYLIEDKSQTSYAVLDSDIDAIYNDEHFELGYREMLDILTILVYQKYKGLGIIDTLRGMNIDGLNCGACGSILQNISGSQNKKVNKATRSVFMFYNSKYIHMRFMAFSNEDELRRIVQLIARYNSPGPLTEKRGYIVNTMSDKSRTLSIRPSVGEYWAVFIRKFTLKSYDPRQLYIKDFTVNGELLTDTLMFLMKGQVTTAFTGRQGSGKTTSMVSQIKYIDPKLTIRVLEMAPEMYLREIYPDRNIYSVQETMYISTNELQDALKKSDAAISIVGEVATDAIAARMIQMGQVASIYTLFSHHANRTVDLVEAITNSIVAASGGAATPSTTLPQVIDVIKVDVHLNFTVTGERFVERITEVIKLDKIVPYPEIDEENLELSELQLRKEYYTRVTDRKLFDTRDILKYDLTTHTYVPLNFFSVELSKHMIEAMLPSDRAQFKQYYQKNWPVAENGI